MGKEWPLKTRMNLQVVTNKETFKQIVCFFFFGLLSLMPNVIVFAAAPDVLSGTAFATSSVVISEGLPTLMMKLLAPWFMQKISYLKRVVAIVSLCLMGLIVLVTAVEPFWRLVGIFLLCLGSSLGEITFLALTSHYDDVTVNAFIAGVGCSCIMGTIFYAGMTTWVCGVSPRMVIAMTIPAVLLFLVFYAILNCGQDQKVTHKDATGTRYTALGAGDESSNDSDLEFPEGSASAKSETSITEEQCATARDIYPYISIIFVTFYAKGLINQSVTTTIAFDHSLLSPRDQYQYYSLARNLGDFLGRFHIPITACVCPSLLPYIQIKRTWILGAVQLGHLLFFVLCSWYRYVPHAEYIFILSVTSGFTSGSTYVNSACTVNDMISDSRKKEFALGLFTVGDPVGLLTAGLMGLYVEPMLTGHCLNDLKLGRLCLTRYSLEGRWTNARICT